MKNAQTAAGRHSALSLAPPYLRSPEDPLFSVFSCDFTPPRPRKSDRSVLCWLFLYIPRVRDERAFHRMCPLYSSRSPTGAISSWHHDLLAIPARGDEAHRCRPSHGLRTQTGLPNQPTDSRRRHPFSIQGAYITTVLDASTKSLFRT